MNLSKLTKAELVQMMKAKENDIADLRQQAEDANKFKEEHEFAIDSLKTQLEDSQEAVKTKDKELKEVKEQFDDYKNDVINKTKEIQGLRKQVTTLTETNESLTKENAAHIRTIESNKATADKVNTWKGVAAIFIVAFVIAVCIIAL